MIYSIKDKLSNVNMKSSDIIISEDSITKIKDTVNYSMNKDGSQNKIDVIKRCKVAILAEQITSELLDGSIVNNEINYDDPFTFAYDVCAGSCHHYGRVEVKASQSSNDWITINISKENISNSINLYHFLEYDVADMIVIYKFYNGIYSTKYVGDKKDIKRYIKKSNFNGWYLHL